MTEPAAGGRPPIRAPLVVVGIGALGTCAAFVLDETPAYEWALTIGAPSLMILILGLIWLVGMIIWSVVNSRSERKKLRPK